MQFALQKPFGKKYDVDVQTFVTQLLDIQPHAPYNKQARKAAKEKAALRLVSRHLLSTIEEESKLANCWNQVEFFL